MSHTYLNGKITVTSLAAPTEEDIANLKQLSDAERKQLLDEHLSSPACNTPSNATMDEIWERALKKARAASETHAVSPL
jgi:hypothetical protein